MQIFIQVLTAALFLILTITPLNGQASLSKPAKVYRIIYTQRPKEWYVEQTKLWKTVLDKNPRNPEAWANYYLATEYSYLGHAQAGSVDGLAAAELNRIIKDMKKYVPDTYEYCYFAHRNGNKDLSLLEKAHRLRPDGVEALYALVVEYVLRGEDHKAQEALARLYETQDITTGLLNYNYNVLMSTEKNALLLTNGDNDTYPAWVLQSVKGIREDVSVLNVPLIHQNRDYLARLLRAKNIKIATNKLPKGDRQKFTQALCEELASKYPGSPLYLAATMHARYREPLQENLYLIGLALRYDPKNRLDNLALLQRNFERYFRLDYLKFDWYSESHIATQSIVKHLNINYLNPIIMLLKHYQAAGEQDKFRRLRSLALDIARKSGNQRRLLDFIREE